MTGITPTRLAFQFDGELDGVPTDAAAALAGMARALLKHGDEHDGRPATMRLERLGPLLNLWLTDPECSPACLCRSGHLPSTADQRDTPPGDVRLALDSGPDEGLRLHWALVLAEPGAAHEFRPSDGVPTHLPRPEPIEEPTHQQERGAGNESDEERTSQGLAPGDPVEPRPGRHRVRGHVPHLLQR